jgi:hypothetical protein
LNPDVPAVAQQRTSPFRSVIVTVVLLNVALMCATARVTFRRTLRRFDFPKTLSPPDGDTIFHDRRNQKISPSATTATEAADATACL